MNTNTPPREMILALALFTTSAIAAPTGTAPHANRALVAPQQTASGQRYQDVSK